MKTMFLKTLLSLNQIFFTHAAYDRCDLARTLVYEHYFDNQHIADCKFQIFQSLFNHEVGKVPDSI